MGKWEGILIDNGLVAIGHWENEQSALSIPSLQCCTWLWIAEFLNYIESDQIRSSGADSGHAEIKIDIESKSKLG